MVPWSSSEQSYWTEKDWEAPTIVQMMFHCIPPFAPCHRVSYPGCRHYIPKFLGWYHQGFLGSILNVNVDRSKKPKISAACGSCASKNPYSESFTTFLWRNNPCVHSDVCWFPPSVAWDITWYNIIFFRKVKESDKTDQCLVAIPISVHVQFMKSACWFNAK